MKILSADKIREADAYTIKNEPISSIDLMERAGDKCFRWIYDRAPELFPEKLDEREYTFKIFCGVGNNGGDGLVIARLLNRNGYDVEVLVVEFSDKFSPDFEANFKRLGKGKVGVHRIKKKSDIPEIDPNSLVVDAMFGTGISRPVEGIAGDVIEAINKSRATVIAIDMPSGLFDEDNSKNDRAHIVNAHHTLTFQFLKLAFLFGENALHVGNCQVLDIGLHPTFIEQTEADKEYLTEIEIRSLIRSREKFSHKGTYGHTAIIAGGRGKYGAAIMCTQAALRAGSGLVSAHLPKTGTEIIQVAVPEAMVQEHQHDNILTGSPDISGYAAIAIGPGLGTEKETEDLVHHVLQNAEAPVVIDADAVNALSENKAWWKLLKPNMVLTPHPGEFKRIAGDWKNDFERHQLQVEWAQKHNVYLVLKGAHTTIATPEGKVYFNSTGNPGMATGGSGDVLTGIIAGLAAQGYSVLDAARIGVFLHGKSGDIAVQSTGQESLVATDIIEKLGKAFLSLNLPSK